MLHLSHLLTALFLTKHMNVILQLFRFLRGFSKMSHEICVCVRVCGCLHVCIIYSIVTTRPIHHCFSRGFCSTLYTLYLHILQ